MAHRSNQAVASQEPALPPVDEPPRPRRYLIGWVTALAALAVSTVLVLAGVWLARIPLAEFMIGAYLAERGAEADFQVTSLDLQGAILEDVRFGAETAPDVSIRLIEAQWRWRGLSPALDRIRVTEPTLRLRLDRRGRVSAGALDHFRAGPPGRRRPALPRIALNVVSGRIFLDAPFGAVEGTLTAEGRLGEDFNAVARIPPTTRPGTEYALEDGAAELFVVSQDDAITARLSASTGSLLWGESRAGDARVVVLAASPLDLSRFDIEAALQLGLLDAPSVDARELNLAITASASTAEDALDIRTWQAQARGGGDLAIEEVRIDGARVQAEAEGEGNEGRVRWSVGGDRFVGVGLISRQPAATGRLFLTQNAGPTGDALITLAQTALDPKTQDDLRRAIPDLRGSPVGPTFAQAERALDIAADSFTLTAPVQLSRGADGARLTLLEPIEARAASGTRLRLSPLRRDTPALALEWPGPTLSGSIALELSGGGAPTAALLLDTVASSAEAPFEADGTLTLENWQAENASIAARELGISISARSGGTGQIDLRGPARITGPVGDGQVRELVAPLDLVITWGNGWRVTPTRCLPVTMGGLDAAGLSFSNGDFGLCAPGGALIAADRAGNLSGGFTIRELGLNGRLAGEGDQPARLGAANVVGRFGGRSGDMILALAAEQPTLTLRFAEDRTMAVRMQRITANARIADSWRIEGAFNAGTLSDPTLPGSVSAIEGSWSAAPEEDGAVIRVAAAEALLTANRPTTEDELPLFHPIRLVNVDALLRQGMLTADGEVILASPTRQLATLTAQHDMDAGAGAAQILAPDVAFGPNLQPYDITERARGLVESVVGSAAIRADIGWTRDTLTSNARVRFNNVSLATATIPIIENVNGEVFFDDLFTLTTPPGQVLSIGLLNPGVAVRNGTVRFQLLSDQRVAIEQAEFDFASGVLAMQPTTITLGADETRFELTLRDVDAASLLSTLNVPDLSATGTLQGSFPLILTRRSAFVEGGVARASGEGVISYTGNAGDNATGVSKIAFDALRSFRYDALSLTLDGDLNGDVISSIEFSGRNTGRPVDLGPIAPVPGVGSVTVRGVPFVFNVRVTAPFRRLAQTAATIIDPGSLIERGRNGQDQEQVDPEAPAPE